MLSLTKTENHTLMTYIPLYSAALAFVVTFFLIPPIINVAKVKKLYDVPNGRSSHTEITPSLGGIGIFAGMMMSLAFWAPFRTFATLQYVLVAFFIIFLIGVRDDILPLAPRKKLYGQIAAALVLIFGAGVLITSLYGVFGVWGLPHWVAVLISLFTYIVVINSVNLIDGINGLAGSLTVLLAGLFGTWFWMLGDIGYAVLSFSLLGATLGFLKYNYTPARIFMGDTGSLLVGTTLAVLAIHFMEANGHLTPENPLWFDSVPAIVVSLLVLPLFDTMRVFIRRMLKGKSPFSPDKTHIHHVLLDLGLSHMQATGILVGGTLLFFGMAFMLQSIGTTYLVLLIVSVATLVSTLLSAYAKKRQNMLDVKQDDFSLKGEIQVDDTEVTTKVKVEPK